MCVSIHIGGLTVAKWLMCLTKMLSTSFHNIFLFFWASHLFLFLPILSHITAETRWRLWFQTHPDTISFFLSLSLWGNWVGFLNSLLFPLSVCVLLHYSLFHRQQMLEGVRSSNTHFLIVLCSDWCTSLGPNRRHMVGYITGHWPTYNLLCWSTWDSGLVHFYWNTHKVIRLRNVSSQSLSL